jgi:hypothetical protein
MTEMNPRQRVGWEYLFDHKLVRNYSLQYEFGKAIGNKTFYEVKGWDLVGVTLEDFKTLNADWPLFVPNDYEVPLAPGGVPEKSDWSDIEKAVLIQVKLFLLKNRGFE